MSRYTIRRTGLAIALSLIVLIIGLSLAWFGGYGYLPLDPHLVVPTTIILFIAILILSVTTMMAGTSFIARQNSSTIPKSPMDNILSRGIRDSISGVERIVKAPPDVSIRDILVRDWTFRKKVSTNWYVVDENGNDVTDWPICNWEGIAVIRFDDYLG